MAGSYCWLTMDLDFTRASPAERSRKRSEPFLPGGKTTAGSGAWSQRSLSIASAPLSRTCRGPVDDILIRSALTNKGANLSTGLRGGTVRRGGASLADLLAGVNLGIRRGCYSAKAEPFRRSSGRRIVE